MILHDEKRVLLVTAKWPYVSSSTDGGDSTLFEVIQSVGKISKLDVFCFRDDIQENVQIPCVNRVLIHNEDFAIFSNYSLHNEDKFMCRLEQAQIAAEKIRSLQEEYDLIIVQHAMFVLDMENDDEILYKTVLFPMFTGTSYRIAGEMVPQVYINHEKQVFHKLKRIITPSLTEKSMLMNDYRVEADKIEVIPRAVKYKYKNRMWSKKAIIRLIYVASVRIQKNHISAIKLVKILKERGYEVFLECAGAIQDDHIFQECMGYITMYGLRENIRFLGNRSSEDVCACLDKSDINISVSLWETFGRGIYEGLAMGIPTVVLEQLRCVTNASNIGIYPVIAGDIDDMAEKIIMLWENKEQYEMESQKGEYLGSVLSEQLIYERLRESILG